MSAITLKQGPQPYTAYAPVKLTIWSPDMPLSTSDILLMALPLPGLHVTFTSTVTHVCAFSCTFDICFEILTHSTDSSAVICAHHHFSIKEVSVDALTALPQKWHHLKEEQWQMLSVKGKWVRGDSSVGKALTTKHKDLTSTLSTHTEVWWVKMCSQS